MANIVVLGAGVSGLTSALLLAKHNKDHVITVVAKHMPGDFHDAEYASPWAGANVLPMADEATSRWERRTWPELQRLATEEPAAGIHLQKARIYRRREDSIPDADGPSMSNIFLARPWWADLLPDYRELEPSELTADAGSGCEFGSVCINPALYLPWLASQCLARGVVLRRGAVAHVSDAAGLHHHHQDKDSSNVAGVMVVNCTGLLASRLGGVMDGLVRPARGQTVLVRNESSPMLVVSGTADGAGELCYLMQRAAGGGTILGGTYQVGSWDGRPDPAVAERIMRRVVERVPDMAGGKGVEGLDVVRHGVGLRPLREGGARVEREKVGDGWVVHNYGHAGWGYQGSYGCAERVVELVEEIMREGA